MNQRLASIALLAGLAIATNHSVASMPGDRSGRFTKRAPRRSLFFRNVGFGTARAGHASPPRVPAVAGKSGSAQSYCTVRPSSWVCDIKVRRFAQMPANRKNPGVHHTARQSRRRQTGYSQWQPTNSKGGNWWQAPFCGPSAGVATGSGARVPPKLLPKLIALASAAGTV